MLPFFLPLLASDAQLPILSHMWRALRDSLDSSFVWRACDKESHQVVDVLIGEGFQVGGIAESSANFAMIAMRE